MKKRVLTKWLKALRSGKYKQGSGALCQIDKKGNESFCCLGVLCDLYNKEQKRNKKRVLRVKKVGPDSWMVGAISAKPVAIKTYDDSEGTLPDEVIKWAGFAELNNSGEFMYMDGVKAPTELINLNDGNSSMGVKRRTFEQIANIIEKHHTQL